MNKKTLDVNELDIPLTARECWEKYPKHRWVYDTSRLLDSQHIKWSPFKVDLLDSPVFNLPIDANDMNIKPINDDKSPGFIFIEETKGIVREIEVYILKGEIKLIRAVGIINGKAIEMPVLDGEIELRINAFVTLHFQKYTGVLHTTMKQNNIYKASLKPIIDLDAEQNNEVIKLIKKIYKKHDIDDKRSEDRALHESLAS